MSADPIKYASYPARITVRHGVPICPCCNVEMVLAGVNQWECPDGAAIWRVIGARMAEAIDGVLSDPSASGS